MVTLPEVASARVKAILTSDAAVGREAQANYIAHSTAESFESAIAILSAAPAGATSAVSAAAAKAGWARAVAKANAGRANL